MSQLTYLKLPTSSAKQQMMNKVRWNSVRNAHCADFYTVGYAGRKTEAVLDAFQTHGISTVVDIRQNPVSMYRPEFSKRNLITLLHERSIDYMHLPDLGVPRDVRAKAIDSGNRDVIWSWYDEFAIEPFLRQNLHFFLNAFEHPIALMCSELDPHECHRHRLALALEDLGLRGYDL